MTGKRGRGQPRMFETEDDFREAYEAFMAEVRANDYAVVPTKTEFSFWLKDNGYGDGDRKTIYNTLHKYFPSIKEEFKAAQAEMFVQGSMKNKYHATATIFALKNMCDWRDQAKTEIEVGEQTRQALTTAEKMKLIREAVTDYAEHK